MLTLYLFTVYGERDDSLPPAIAAKIRALAGEFFIGNAIGELCGRVQPTRTSRGADA